MYTYPCMCALYMDQLLTQNVTYPRFLIITIHVTVKVLCE